MHKNIYFSLARQRIIIAVFITLILLYFITESSAAAECKTQCVFKGTEKGDCYIGYAQYPGWTWWICTAPCKNTCSNINRICQPICLANSSYTLEGIEVKYRADIYVRDKYNVYSCQDYKWCDTTKSCEADGLPYKDREYIGTYYCYETWTLLPGYPLFHHAPNGCCCI